MSYTLSVPESDLDSVAEQLNTLGMAYYRFQGNDYLVKLAIRGNTYRVDEWLME